METLLIIQYKSLFWDKIVVQKDRRWHFYSCTKSKVDIYDAKEKANEDKGVQEDGRLSPKEEE